jgi:hypothetical protein
MQEFIALTFEAIEQFQYFERVFFCFSKVYFCRMQMEANVDKADFEIRTEPEQALNIAPDADNDEVYDITTL